MKGSTQKNIKITFLAVFLTSLFVLMINLPSQGENDAYDFIEAILKEYEYCKKVIKKPFNKNLIMSEEEEKEQFQSSNICWICGKPIDNDNEKIVT